MVAFSRFAASMVALAGYCLHRHCEPTGRANARPMTGSAKQSSDVEAAWIASSLSVLAITAAFSLLLRQLLCCMPKHVSPRLLIEGRLFEFTQGKPRLHLRSCPHVRVPTLDVGIIVERKALSLMRHGPGKTGDVGDRIIARDVAPGLAQLRIEHPIKPRRLVAVAFDGIGDFFRRVEREMSVLAE